jgi:ATP-dependent DNA helicase RecG
MKMAIDVMNQSIAEHRDDGKPCPKVGAVLVSPDGKYHATAYRGELREGDHAEFTLLERKHRDKDLTGFYLFATLEPCAPGARRHPKLGCAERIVNARIAKAWIGIEDPDPTVDRKGILYLEQKGIEVQLFDEEFQDEIRQANKEFLASAIKRSEETRTPKEIILSPLEKRFHHGNIGNLSPDALNLYIAKANLPYEHNSAEFYSFLKQQELLINDEAGTLAPTGLCFLLFGNNPRLTYPQAVVKAEMRYKNAEPHIKDFNEPLVLLPEKIESWLKEMIPSTISREQFTRKENYEYPLTVLREAIVNALVHRDYDMEQAKIYLVIEEDKITVKSPGAPVSPIKWDDFKNFKAPSLNRNPKIMSIFNQMGFAEERGIGMREMKSIPQKYHLPLPDISMNEPYIEIVFPRTGDFLESSIGSERIYAELNEEERKGLLLLHDRKIVSKKEYAQHFKFDEKKAQRHLSKFRKLGLTVTQGNGPSLKYVFTK